MSLASLVPEVDIDVASIPSFIPPDVLYDALYPYSPPFSHIVDTRTDCPPWNADLEAYFQTFHWMVFMWLQMDHSKDDKALSALRARLDKLERSSMARKADEGATRDDLAAAIAHMEARQRSRWEKLYGLWDVRDKFLKRFEGGCLVLASRGGVATILGPAEFEPPKAAPQSLWPISEPPDQAEEVICLHDEGVDWSEYAIPADPTADSDETRRRPEAAQSTTHQAGDEPTFGLPQDDDGAPLLAQAVEGARSSRILTTFSGLLRRRTAQAV